MRLLASCTLFLSAIAEEAINLQECQDTFSASCTANNNASDSKTVRAKAHDTKGYTTRADNSNKKTKDEPSISSNGAGDLPPPNTCALYLAPSTIPHAILGLFSGSSIPKDENANTYLSGTYPGFVYNEEDDPLWSDLYIPIADVYKTLPYRGQQRYPSWLQYVWGAKRGMFHHEGEMNPFPNLMDEIKGYDDGLNREFFELCRVVVCCCTVVYWFGCCLEL